MLTKALPCQIVDQWIRLLLVHIVPPKPKTLNPTAAMLTKALPCQVVDQRIRLLLVHIIARHDDVELGQALGAHHGVDHLASTWYM